MNFCHQVSSGNLTFHSLGGDGIIYPGRSRIAEMPLILPEGVIIFVIAKPVYDISLIVLLMRVVVTLASFSKVNPDFP